MNHLTMIIINNVVMLDIEPHIVPKNLCLFYNVFKWYLFLLSTMSIGFWLISAPPLISWRNSFSWLSCMSTSYFKWRLNLFCFNDIVSSTSIPDVNTWRLMLARHAGFKVTMVNPWSLSFVCLLSGQVILISVWFGVYM